MAAPRKRKKEPPFDVTGIDFSVITTALQTGGKMIEQIMNGIHYGSPEVRLLMLEECDFIIECRVCRGLFRALPNFIAHKRVYCCQPFCDHSPNMAFQAATAFTPPQEEPVVVLPTMPEDIAPEETGQVAHQPKCNDRSKDKDQGDSIGKPGPVSDRPKGRPSTSQGKAPAEGSSSSDSRKAGDEAKLEAGGERSGMKTRSRPTDKTMSSAEDDVVALTQAQVGVSKDFVTLTAAMGKIERDKEIERSAAPLHLTPIPSNPCAVFVNNKNAVAGEVVPQPVDASSDTVSVSKALPVSGKEPTKKPENCSKVASSPKSTPQTSKTVTSAEQKTKTTPQTSKTVTSTEQKTKITPQTSKTVTSTEQKTKITPQTSKIITSTEQKTASDRASVQSSKVVTDIKSNVRGTSTRNAQVTVAKATLRSVRRVVRELQSKKDELLSKKELAAKNEARLSSQKHKRSSTNAQPKPTPTLSTVKPQFRQPVAATVTTPSIEKPVPEVIRVEKSSTFVAKRGESPVSQTTDSEGNLRAVVKRCLTGRPWALRTSPLKTRSVDGSSDVDSLSNAGSVSEPGNSSDKEEQKQEKTGDEHLDSVMDLENLCCRACNFKFGQKKTLIYHCQTRHSGQRTIFPCPYCQRVFYYFWGLTRHLHNNHRKHPSDIDRMRKSLRRRAYKQDMTIIPLDALERGCRRGKGSKEIPNPRRTQPSLAARKVVAASKVAAASPTTGQPNKPSPELPGVSGRRRRVEVITPAHSKSKKVVDVYKKVYLNKRGTHLAGNTRLSASLKERGSRRVEAVGHAAERSSPPRETVSRRKIVVVAKPHPSPSKENASTRKRLVAKALRVTRSKQVYKVAETSLTQPPKDQKSQRRATSRSPAVSEAQSAGTPPTQGGTAAKICIKDSGMNVISRTVLVPKVKDGQVYGTVKVVNSRVEAVVRTPSDQAKPKLTVSPGLAVPGSAAAAGSPNKEQKKMTAQPQTHGTALDIQTRAVNGTPPLQTRLNVKMSAASPKMGHLTQAKTYVVSPSSSWGDSLLVSQHHTCPHCQKKFGRKIGLDSHAKICIKAKPQVLAASQNKAGSNVIIVRPKVDVSKESGAVSQTPSRRSARDSSAEKSELKTQSQQRSASPRPKQTSRDVPVRDCRTPGSHVIKNESITPLTQRSKNPNLPNPGSSSRESSVDSHDINDIDIQVSVQTVERESRSRRKADSKASSSRDSSVDSIRTRSSDAKHSRPPSRAESASSTRSSRDRSADALGKGSLQEKARLEENLLAISRQRLSQQLHAATTTREKDATKESSSSCSASVEGKEKVPPAKSLPTKIVPEKVLSHRTVTTTVLRKTPREKSSEAVRNPPRESRSGLSTQDNPPPRPSRPGVSVQLVCSADMSQHSPGERPMVAEKQSAPAEKKGALEVKPSQPSTNQSQTLDAEQAVSLAVSKGGEPGRAPRVSHQGEGAASASEELAQEGAEGLSQRPRRKRRAPSKVVESMESYAESKRSDSAKRIHPDLDVDDGRVNDSSAVTGPPAKKGAYCLPTKGEGKKGEEKDKEGEDLVTIVEEIWMEKKPGRPTERIKSNRIYVVEPARAGRLTCQDTRKVGQIVDESGLTCLQCDQSFTSVSNLRRHAIRHLGWRRFKCRLCRFCSYNRSECNTHIMRTHPERLRSSGSGGARIDTFITDLGRQGASVRSLKKRQTLDSQRKQGEKDGRQPSTHRTYQRPNYYKRMKKMEKEDPEWQPDALKNQQKEKESKDIAEKKPKKKQKDPEWIPPESKSTASVELSGASSTRLSLRKLSTPPTSCENSQTDPIPPFTTTTIATPTSLVQPAVTKITHVPPMTMAVTAQSAILPAVVVTAIPASSSTVRATVPTSTVAVPNITASPTLSAAGMKSSPTTAFNISTRNSPRKFDTRPYPRPAPTPAATPIVTTRKGSYTKISATSFSQGMAQGASKELSQRTPVSIKGKLTPMMVGKVSVSVTTAAARGSQGLQVVKLTSPKESGQLPKPRFVLLQKSSLEKSSASSVVMEKDGLVRSSATGAEDSQGHSAALKSKAGVMTRSGGTADAKEVAGKGDESGQLFSSTSKEKQESEGQGDSRKAEVKRDKGDRKGEGKEQPEEVRKEVTGQPSARRSAQDSDLVPAGLEEMQTLPQNFMSGDAAMDTCNEKSSPST